MRSRDEHNHEHRRADERGRSQIDFGDNKDESGADDRERNYESLQPLAALFLPGGEPRRQKENDGDLGDLRRLKSRGSQRDPASRTIDPHSEMRDETKRQGDQRSSKPDPPGPEPEMVI